MPLTTVTFEVDCDVLDRRFSTPGSHDIATVAFALAAAFRYRQALAFHDVALLERAGIRLLPDEEMPDAAELPGLPAA